MNRTGTYTAFYVKEPFYDTNLGSNSARDFCYYNTIRMWKGKDSQFPFIDSHRKTYNVRDSSSWETLKERLHERLRCSKNIILILSNITVESRALKEELEYGMFIQELPVIVIYPEYQSNYLIASNGHISSDIKSLWSNVPTFKKYAEYVPVIHIPFTKEYLLKALNNYQYSYNTKEKNGNHYYDL